MAPQIFNNISPARFLKLKAKAQEAGLYIGADSGKAELKTPLGRLKFDYAYSVSGMSLLIHCTDKPFLVKESQVKEKLETLVTATA